MVVAGIGIGEKGSNIPYACSSQQRINDGMYQYVGVAVALQSVGKWDLHPAYHQWPTGFQLVNVITVTNLENICPTGIAVVLLQNLNPLILFVLLVGVFIALIDKFFNKLYGL